MVYKMRVSKIRRVCVFQIQVCMHDADNALRHIPTNFNTFNKSLKKKFYFKGLSKCLQFFKHANFYEGKQGAALKTFCRRARSPRLLFQRFHLDVLNRVEKGWGSVRRRRKRVWHLALHFCFHTLFSHKRLHFCQRFYKGLSLSVSLFDQQQCPVRPFLTWTNAKPR